MISTVISNPNHPNTNSEFSMNTKVKPQKKKMPLKRPKIKEEFDNNSEMGSIFMNTLFIVLRGLIKMIEFFVDVMVGIFLKNFIRIFRDSLHSIRNKVIKAKNMKLYFQYIYIRIKYFGTSTNHKPNNWVSTAKNLTLILDLDETLVYCSTNNFNGSTEEIIVT